MNLKHAMDLLKKLRPDIGAERVVEIRDETPKNISTTETITPMTSSMMSTKISANTSTEMSTASATSTTEADHGKWFKIAI